MPEAEDLLIRGGLLVDGTGAAPWRGDLRLRGGVIAEIGLVSRTVPDEELLDTALDLAAQINGWSTQGVSLTKRMIWAGLESGSLDTAIELESHTQLFVRMTTQNFEEATRARKEGRKPVFRD